MPISFLFSSIHFLISGFFCLISSSSLIVSKICLLLSPFYCFQFRSNLSQYSLSYLLFDHPNNFFAINLPGNFPLLNISSSLSYQFTFFMFQQYSFSYSFITFLEFSKFSLPSQVSDSAVNPFQHTKYLSLPFIHCLFKILSTSHFSSSPIITGTSCSFLCPSTYPTYRRILLTLTIRGPLTHDSRVLPVAF